MEFKALENERWIWANTFNEDYSDEYLVSDMGRCWSIKKKKFVGAWHNGYWTVGLSKKNKQENMMVGRLMLISFGIPIPQYLKDLPTSKLHCMHLDGDSHNNHLDNFAWGDAKENQNEINHRIRLSEALKGKNSPMLGKYGREHHRSKPILQYSKNGTFLRDWDCTYDVERQLGIHHSNISKCAMGKLGSAGGYLWKYKEEMS